MRFDQLFESQDQLLERQEEIFLEIQEAGGEITPGQEMELDSIQKEFDKYESLITQYPDKIGFIISKMNKELEDIKEWEYRCCNKKKAREKKIENFKAWVGRTIRNVIGEGEKIKGNLVTIKDISNMIYREVVDKELFPLKYQDFVFKIAFEEWEKLSNQLSKIKANDKETCLDLLLNYQTKNIPNESRAKSATELVPGVVEKKKYNCQFWGLQKIKEKKEVVIYDETEMTENQAHKIALKKYYRMED
jgi:uncharacterized protein YdcH (DUF465 family)